jgi:hypothetical protein
MENVITVKTLAGRNVATGEQMEHPCDLIECNGQKIGFCEHVEGATVRLLRRATEPTVQKILAAVAQQRKAQGKPGIRDRVSMPPSGDAVRAALSSTNPPAIKDEDDSDE